MSFEDKLLERLEGKANQWPYRVIQVKPNKKKDYEIYALSGREEDIAANGSLFLALYDLLAKDKIDFEEFWEGWEMGFPKLTERIETNYATTNWRKPDSRPRYREWKDPSPGATKNNYRVIEYWRDRSLESESIVLVGTDSQLIEHIIQIEYEASGGTNAGLGGKNSKPPLKGWPALVLSFLEPNEKVRRKPDGTPKRRLTGEKIIRAVGYTDDRKIAELGLGELIKSSDIRRWATRIQEQFASPPYRWQKGRECLSYSGQIARVWKVMPLCDRHSKAEIYSPGFLKYLTILPTKRDFDFPRMRNQRRRSLQTHPTFSFWAKTGNPIPKEPSAKSFSIQPPFTCRN